jgi:hypothetical protein
VDQDPTLARQVGFCFNKRFFFLPQNLNKDLSLTRILNTRVRLAPLLGVIAGGRPLEKGRSRMTPPGLGP